MLYTIMKHIRNYFPCVTDKEDTFRIENGTISLSFIKNGQYILIDGSSFNDGVYKYPVAGLIDEEFTGNISVRAIPKDFLALASEIENYVDNHSLDGLQSESFNGYSYTRVSNASGGVADWQTVFRERLNCWRKI